MVQHEGEFVKLEDELRRARDESARARSELRDIQQLLTDFLNHNPALSFIKDEEGRYLYASKSFADFFNVEPKEFLGRTDFEWLPEELAKHFTENDNEVRSTGQPLETVESVPFPR